MLQEIGSLEKENGFLFFAIRKVGRDQNHSAIIFRDGANNLRMLHLCWNYQLRLEDPSPSYLWSFVGIPPAEARFLAVLCDRIAKRMPGIPYGLDAEGFSIDPDTGNVTVGPAGKGFTCATFILAILRSHGFNLLAENEWPENANQAWQEHIVAHLEQDPHAPEDQRAAVRRDVGSRRFAPEEVVGSASEPVWPVSFPEAQRIGAEVNQDLTNFVQRAA